MRWAIFYVSFFTLLFSTGSSAFAKSRNLADNTRNTGSRIYQLAQQAEKRIVYFSNAADQELHEKLIYTADEEDDIPVSAPARRQLQNILACFLAAFLSPGNAPLPGEWYLAADHPVQDCDHAQLCVFRI